MIQTPEHEPLRREITPEKASIRTNSKWSALQSMDFTTAEQFHNGVFKPTRKTFVFSFLAHLIDEMLIVSSVFFALSFCLYMNRGQNLFLAEENGFTHLFLPAGVLYIFILSLVMTVPRIFLGCTPGEWTLNLRLGHPEQRFSSKYTFFVLKRYLICFLTGGLTLLVISVVTGVDCAGKLSKLPVIEKGRA